MMLKNIKIFLLLTLIILLENKNIVLAGTSQIFSPAGLPRSNNQDYSIPDTTVPVQTFPTPPIPLRDAAIKSFPIMPLRRDIKPNNNNQSTTGENLEQNISPIVSDQAKVETFFQIDSSLNTDQNQYVNKNNLPLGGVGKFLWHTLDNIGVPMVMSKDDVIDPSLKKQAISKTSAALETATPPCNLNQNIPDSQFEINDLPLKDNAKAP
jgi:hypothetical protein